MRRGILSKTFILMVFACGLLTIAGCKKEKGCTDPDALNYNPDAESDDGSCIYGLQVPDEYNFENVFYGGQTVRLLLLKDLVAEIESGNATVASLNAIYENTNNAYTEIATDKNLRDKVANDAMHDSIQLWFSQIEAMGGNYIRQDSVDLRQMIEKTLMGAVFFYRAVNDYLLGFADDDNSTIKPGEGTEMEHHADEAFGYFGAARDYKTAYTDAQIVSPGEFDSNGDGVIDPGSEKCFYYAQTAAKRDLGSAGFSPDAQTDYTTELFDAFLTLRAAISANDFLVRDQKVTEIISLWEEIIAATVIHYINETASDIANNGSDLKKHWAEMKGYLNMLPHYSNNKLGTGNINTLNNLMGNNPNQTTLSNLDSARNIIATAYGFTSEQANNW